MTEQQQYDVIARTGHFELRDYAACVVADVRVTGSAESAGSIAFRPLLAYITGANRSGAKLAMTAPVVQEPAGESLAMTAPVLQQGTADGQWTVSFVLPGTRDVGEYPEPLDERVRLRAVAPQRAAAIRWSGRWTSGNVARRTAELEEQMADRGWIADGPARWARFDPPWKPPFARRNEIVIPVAQDSPRVLPK